MFEQDADQWQQQEDFLNRERETVEVLERCAAAGVKSEDLQTLARECGVKWNPDAHARTNRVG